MIGVVAVHQVLQALPPITPRLAHHALAAEVEQIEQNEGHVPARAFPFSEYRVDALVAAALIERRWPMWVIQVAKHSTSHAALVRANESGGRSSRVKKPTSRISWSGLGRPVLRQNLIPLG
jgi:hypothetical protein